MPTLEKLNNQFGIARRLAFSLGNGDLPVAELKAGDSEAQVYLHGAHVTHFARAGGTPILFMSSKSLFQAGKAIRGGVPICFPWFGARADDASGKSPAHGFARLMDWKVAGTFNDGATTSLTLELNANEATRAMWAGEFAARYTVTLGDALTLDLTVENKGEKVFTFEEALHSYFSVSDVRAIGVEGFAGASYIDKTAGNAVKVQDATPIKITGETDRVYVDHTAAGVIIDPGHGQKIVNTKVHSGATVIWNPWIAKAKAMADFGDDEWPGMMCVETANVGACAVRLGPGDSHSMRAVIGVSRL